MLALERSQLRDETTVDGCMLAPTAIEGKARGGILILPDWAAAEQALLARPSVILVSAAAKFDDPEWSPWLLVGTVAELAGIVTLEPSMCHVRAAA